MERVAIERANARYLRQLWGGEDAVSEADEAALEQVAAVRSHEPAQLPLVPGGARDDGLEHRGVFEVVLCCDGLGVLLLKDRAMSCMCVIQT